MNTHECSECRRYHVILRTAKKGDVPTKRGICLAQSVYATNAVDKEEKIIPPGARTERLPYGNHQLVAVRGNDVKPHCQHFKK